MNPRTKTLFAILFGIPLLLAATCAVIVFVVSRAGSLEFSIHEKHGGSNVEVRLPAILVPVTMAFVRLPFNDELPCGGGNCGIPFGVVSGALSALSDCPDGVLVDINTAEDIVRIEKRAGRIVVYIDTPDETVSAAIPLRASGSVLAPI